MPAAPVRSVLATNAVLGRFGLGAPGARTLAVLAARHGPALALVRGSPGEPPPGAATRVLPPPAWVRVFSRTRLRRLALRGQEAERLEFDRLAARALPPCRLAVLENSTALLTMARARAAGARVALVVHNHAFRELDAAMEEERARWGGPRFFTSPAMVERTERELREADLVLANSASTAASLLRAGADPARTRVLRFGVDAERFRPAAAEPPGFTVGFVGWLDLRKGYPYLVEAFRDAALPGSRLLLHGGTDERHHHETVERLRGGADARVVRGDPLDTFRASAVTVLPSVEDGFGQVVLESMACGVPAIVTDRCGVAAEVRDGVDGFVVPARDAAVLRDRLRLLHADPALRRRMGEAARAAAVARPWSRFEGDLADALATLDPPGGGAP